MDDDRVGREEMVDGADNAILPPGAQEIIVAADHPAEPGDAVGAVQICLGAFDQ